MKTEEEIYDIIFKELNEREFVSPGGHNIIFLIGGPGSGKSTQGERIFHNFAYKILSLEDFIIDSYMKNQLNKFEDIINGIKEGKIIPSEEYVLIIKEAITKK